MIAYVCDWFRRVLGRFDASRSPTPPQPDNAAIAAIAAKYQSHDITIARLQDRQARVSEMNEALTTGTVTGNIVSDIFSGGWPPRHKRRRRVASKEHV